MLNKIIIPILCNCCSITLPYIINTENPNKRIGVFGDSFAGLQDELTYSKIHLNDDLWSHEFSWIYYLGHIFRIVYTPLLLRVCSTWFPSPFPSLSPPFSFNKINVFIKFMRPSHISSITYSTFRTTNTSLHHQKPSASLSFHLSSWWNKDHI